MDIMDMLFGFFIFCIILFFYLHIQFHLKVSNELEIYEIDQASKNKLEEICDLRQPVMFDFDEEHYKIMNTINSTYLLDNYPVFEVKIKDISNTDFVPLPLHVGAKLFSDDKKSTYYSEGNQDFLIETGAVKNISYNDEFLRPSLVSNCSYDFIFGAGGTELPFRYDLNYRNFYTVTQGTVKVKLSPPISSKYLSPIKDYEAFEFRSPINPWSPSEKYKADFDKIKCLEITLTPGKFLYIPAYWWYSFKLGDNSSIASLKYRTYMNNIAISNHVCLYALQMQNIDRKIAKTIDISHLSNTTDISINKNDNPENKVEINSNSTNVSNIDELPIATHNSTDI
jgi:hypothetical protein